MRCLLNAIKLKDLRGNFLADTVIEKLNVIMGQLDSKVDSIRGTVISSRDGLEIASFINDMDLNVSLVHATCASIVGLSNRAVSRLGMSSLSKTVMYMTDGIAIAYSIGDTMALFCILDHDANVGLAMIEIENAIEKIQVVMQN